MASASDSAGEASIGRSGVPSVNRNFPSASAPPANAVAAVSGNEPDNMNARRTVSPGTSAARATASSSTPSSAPCRSSPTSSRIRKSCSALVAAAEQFGQQLRRVSRSNPRRWSG